MTTGRVRYNHAHAELKEVTNESGTAEHFPIEFSDFVREGEEAS